MTTWYESSGSPPRNRPLIPPVTEGNLPHGEETIAESLQDAGYLTAHVGKWHLGNAAHYPETHGFDVNVGGTFWGAPSTFFHPFKGFWRRSDELRYVPGLGVGEEGEYWPDRLPDEVLQILETAKDRPFFLNLCYHTVHTPIEGKADLVAHYRDKVRPGMRHTNCEYAAMVHSLDKNVGRLLERIEALGIADRTVVVFLSDNGGYINEYHGTVVTNNAPLRSGKGSLYEGGIRVPLLVRWPGVTRPHGVCDKPVCSCDLYPTILDAVSGRERPPSSETLDGLSLMPVLKDPNATLPRETLYWHYPHYYPTTTPVSAIRHGRWKLLEYLEDERVELYDLEKDLGEANDLSDSMPAKAAQLGQALRTWRLAVEAQMPARNEEDVRQGRG
jgi:arylsulfatase A-like enzyme